MKKKRIRFFFFLELERIEKEEKNFYENRRRGLLLGVGGCLWDD